jgi:hypothetical protein
MLWSNRLSSLLDEYSSEVTSSSLVYSDAAVNGTSCESYSVRCTDWNSFYSSFMINSISKELVSLKTIVTYSLYNNSNNLVEECGDTAVLTSLQTPSTLATGNATIKCKSLTAAYSNSWSLGTCSSGMTMCFNCSLYQVSQLSSVYSPCTSAVNQTCLKTLIPSYYQKYSFARILLATFAEPVAPAVSSITVASYTTFLTVVAKLNVSGALYCIASTAGAPSSVKAIVAQDNVGWTVTTKHMVNVTLGSLVPSTTYTVYCAAKSAQGILSSLSAAISAKVLVSTKCCRVVTLSLSSTSAFGDSSVASVGKLIVPSMRSGSLMVMVTATLVGSVARQSIFFPVNSTFTARSASSVSLAFVGTTASGVYNVTVLLFGSAASNYSVAFSNGNNFKVFSSTATPATPSLAYARFSNDGSYVSVVFNSATNKGGITTLGKFLCSLLFAFDGIGSSQCQWSADSTTVTLYPGSSSSLAVGSPIYLLANKTKASCPSSVATNVCQSWSYTTSTSVSVLAPSSPTTPSVVLSLPASIGSCDDLTLGFGGSTGAGGRSWTSVNVTFLSKATNTTCLSAFVKTISKSRSVIAQSCLQKGFVYTFFVSLCNFLGSCGLSSGSVTVLNSVVPYVNIAGGPTITVSVNNSLQLSSSTYVSSCDGSQSTLNLKYAWSIASNGNSSTTSSALRSQSKDPSKYILAGYQLQSSSSYTVTLMVTSAVTLKSSSATVSVVVAEASLIPVVAGGTQQSARLLSVAVIDASASSDSGQSGSGRAGVSFKWDCYAISPTYSAVCPFRNVSGATNCSVSSYARLPTANTSSVFTLTMYDSSRSAHQQVIVSVLSVGAPLVTMTTTASTKIVVSSAFVLQGQITVDVPCESVWSVDDASISLASVSSVSPSKVLTPSGLTVFSSYLYLTANAMPTGSVLTFTLACTNVNSGSSSSASITVTTNSPPTPGICDVEPAHGIALSTTFVLSAFSWVDSDIPISYEFGFTSPSNVSFVVQSKSQLAFASSLFPAGSSSKNYSLVVSYEIFDNLGSSVTEYLSVRVATVTLNQSRLNAKATSLLAQASGNVDSLKQVISVLSSTMSSVNCSNSPNCTQLNRLECSATANTCGACSSSQYIGIVGDSNQACVDVAVFNTIIASSSGSTCSQDSDCGVWSTCNLQTHSCAFVSKTCLSNCSNAGRCEFLVSATQAVVSTCTIADPSCEASCVCSSRFYGSDCSLTLSELEDTQDTTYQLLVGLQQVNTLEALDEQSAEFLASALQSLTGETSTLSSTAATVAANVTDSILTASISGSVTVSSTVLSGLSSVISSVVTALVGDSRRRRLSSSVSSYNTLLDTFSDAVANQMVSGQVNQNYILSSYRLVASVFDGTGSNVSVSMPQTPLEAHTNASNAMLAAVNPSGIATVGAISLPKYVISDSVSTSDGENISASAIRINLQLDSTVCDDSSSSSYFEFSFAHYDEESYGITNSSSVMMSKQCYKGLPMIHHVMCPHDKNVTVYCNGSSTVVARVECPQPARVPICSLLIGDSSSSSSDSCVVVNYTSTTTTCRCSTCAFDSARRRQLSVSSDFTAQGSSVVALSQYSFIEFAAVMESAAEFSNLSAVKSTVLIISAFAVLWVGMGSLLVGIEYARRWKKSRDKEKGKTATAVVSPDEAVTLEDCLREYIVELFSPAFSDDSDTVRLMRELWNRHEYMSVFAQEFGYQQWVGAFYLLTNLNANFFLLALFYDIQFASDDGTCRLHSDELSCLSKRSMFNAKQTKCLWDVTASSCTWQSPHFSLTTAIAVSVIVLLISVPISFGLFYIFEFILSAPSVVEVEEERVQNLSRRKSAVSMLDDQRRKTLSALNQASKMADSNCDDEVTPRTPSVEAILALQNQKSKSSGVSVFSEVNEMDGSVKRASMRAHRITNPRLSRRQSRDDEDDDKQSNRSYRSFLSFLKDIRRYGHHEAEITGSVEEESKQKIVSEFTEIWKPLLSDENLQAISMHATATTELAQVVTEADDWIKKLKELPREQVGVQILELFVRDYLGRRSKEATIFSQKVHPLKPKYVLTWGIKCVAFSCMLLLNLYFVFACMLYGRDKGHRWQQGWLFTCVVNVAVDVCINAVTVALVMHYFIPNLIVNKARRIRATVNKIVHRLCSNANMLIASQKRFSATSYYFVSSHVARAFPDLLESRIVLANSSFFLSSEQLGKINPEYVSRHDEMKKRSHGSKGFISSVKNTIASRLARALMWFGSQSLLIQETIINMFNPGFVAAIAYMGIGVMKHSSLGIVAGILIMLGGCVAIYYGGKYLLRPSVHTHLHDLDWIEMGMNAHHHETVQAHVNPGALLAMATPRRGSHHGFPHFERPILGELPPPKPSAIIGAVTNMRPFTGDSKPECDENGTYHRVHRHLHEVDWSPDSDADSDEDYRRNGQSGLTAVLDRQSHPKSSTRRSSLDEEFWDDVPVDANSFNKPKPVVPDFYQQDEVSASSSGSDDDSVDFESLEFVTGRKKRELQLTVSKKSKSSQSSNSGNSAVSQEAGASSAAVAQVKSTVGVGATTSAAVAPAKMLKVPDIEWDED